MKLMQTVYIVGAHALGAVRLSITRRNFPNLPVGARTAATSPPRLPPSPRPACHAGTEVAAAAKAAPSMCAGTCPRPVRQCVSYVRGKGRVTPGLRLVLTLETKNPR